MKKYKKDGGFSYTIGVYPTLELLTSRPGCVIRVLVSRRGVTNGGIQRIEALCQRRRIPVEVADCAVDRIAGCENAYVVGVFQKYNAPVRNGNHVVLVNPSDCGNLGTILRTAAAYQIENVAIVRPAVDIFDPKVIRASMGAVFCLNFTYFGTFDGYRSCFDNHLYPFATNGNIPLPRATFDEPFALIFGNEGAGLGDVCRDISDSIAIPQSSAVDSLNLSVAVGIALYASSLQRQP